MIGDEWELSHRLPVRGCIEEQSDCDSRICRQVGFNHRGVFGDWCGVRAPSGGPRDASGLGGPAYGADGVLDDFEQGLREGRFLYSEQLGEEFHRKAIRELCRVAREVRIFPTTGLDSRESPHLEICIGDLKSAGLEATVQQVPYEFHRGANRILRIR